MNEPNEDEVGTKGLEPAELVKVDPAVFKGVHARKAAQQILEAIKEAVVVPNNPRQTAKLRGKYVAQIAAALREAVARI